jgi:hypothetical protein
MCFAPMDYIGYQYKVFHCAVATRKSLIASGLFVRGSEALRNQMNIQKRAHDLW